MNYLSSKDTIVERRGRFEALSEEKLRGGYYTPQKLSEWICAWAIRDISDRVLEPSAGDGNFLIAAAQQLIRLGATSQNISRQITGIELLDSEAHAARLKLNNILGSEHKPNVVSGDFFKWNSEVSEIFDVVVGNPPFLRFQSFPEPARSRAMEAMQRAGLKPNRLTNSWVPFVVGAAESLRLGGRLAMVIPAELLQVSYAAQLRAYLAERFQHIDVVTCNELFFSKAEQEVVVLLCDRARERKTGDIPCRIAFTQADTVDAVIASDPLPFLATAEEKDVRNEKEKWLKYFLSNREIGLLRELRASRDVSTLGQIADVDVGVVTGANEFFVLRKEEIERLGISNLTRRTISRSAHIRGAILTEMDWCELAARNERVNMVNIRLEGNQVLNRRAASYVQFGESKGFHVGYKCSIRTPWFHVPALWNPDMFLFRQIHDFPRLVLNAADATATDTIHRVRVKGDVKSADLTAAVFTSLTAASAEIEGRSYGGGVLELEPSEAERLLIPKERAVGKGLPLAEVDRLLRAGRLEAILQEQDRLLLRAELGLTSSDCKTLKEAWLRLRGRRYARNRRNRAAPVGNPSALS